MRVEESWPELASSTAKHLDEMIKSYPRRWCVISVNQLDTKIQLFLVRSDRAKIDGTERQTISEKCRRVHRCFRATIKYESSTPIRTDLSSSRVVMTLLPGDHEKYWKEVGYWLMQEASFFDIDAPSSEVDAMDIEGISFIPFPLFDRGYSHESSLGPVPRPTRRRESLLLQALEALQHSYDIDPDIWQCVFIHWSGKHFAQTAFSFL